MAAVALMTMGEDATTGIDLRVGRAGDLIGWIA